MACAITVVIPNWNGAPHLPECLASLRAQTFTDFSVLVVDNGSVDESLEWLSREAADVDVLALPQNGGFAVAVNAGINQSASPYVALLNNDTRCEPLWLEKLWDALQQYRDYDVAASLMVVYDSPHLVNAAGDVYDVERGAGANRGIWEPTEDYREPVRVLGACAGAALYRRRFFEDVGLFDEEFFLAAEDTDLNVRGLIVGKKTVYVPTAVVWHKLRATRGVSNRDLELLEIRNNAAVVAKDLPARLALAWLIRWSWSAFRGLVPLRPSKWAAHWAASKGLRETLRSQWLGLRMGLRKRGDVWKRRAIPVSEIERWLANGVGPVE